MSVAKFRGAVVAALMMALAFGAGAHAAAQDEGAGSDAKVIQIGPADAQNEVPRVPGPEGQRPVEMPKYWIGLLGGPVTPEVRHHVQIPENQGLMIREVVPDSPAAKAGIEKFDILLRANDAELHEMTDLVDLVRTQGEQKGQITLEVLRHGERETVYVTPEERPAHVAQQGGRMGGAFGPGFEGGIEGLPGELQQFFGGQLEGGRPFDFRNFGPGVIVGGEGMGMAQMPNGVSISIQKQDGEPTKITVKRGEESWEVIGDDAESLKQLPEDLRPFVERMLRGNGQANFNIEMPELGRMPQHPGFDGERIRERLEAMERQLNEMRERMLGPEKESDAKPATQNGETK